MQIFVKAAYWDKPAGCPADSPAEPSVPN